jgi:hypothetical protein
MRPCSARAEERKTNELISHTVEQRTALALTGDERELERLSAALREEREFRELLLPFISQVAQKLEEAQQREFQRQREADESLLIERDQKLACKIQSYDKLTVSELPSLLREALQLCSDSTNHRNRYRCHSSIGRDTATRLFELVKPLRDLADSQRLAAACGLPTLADSRGYAEFEQARARAHYMRS